MSRAFVKESDGDEGGELPELQVSPHRNLVTATGLRQIEVTVDELQAALSAARAAEDRSGIARIQRDLRYWTERQRTAELVPVLPATGAARFSSTVTLEKADGMRVEYQIVGEDEADPANGTISYVSPIARKLLGAAEGDSVALADGEAEIVGIQ
jgi:transcription elongation GreA/GreB family factor